MVAIGAVSLEMIGWDAVVFELVSFFSFSSYGQLD
jgi:hypothetical protein